MSGLGEAVEVRGREGTGVADPGEGRDEIQLAILNCGVGGISGPNVLEQRRVGAIGHDNVEVVVGIICHNGVAISINVAEISLNGGRT